MAEVYRPTIKCEKCGLSTRPIPPRKVCQRCKLAGAGNHPDTRSTFTPPTSYPREATPGTNHIMRFAAFDIETTGLNATYGRLLCACFKFSDDDEIVTVRCPSFRDEPRALQEISDLWDSSDVVATWNGKRFDVRFVNARLMAHHMKPLESQKMHKDLMYEYKKLGFLGARLETASENLKLKAAKYRVDAEKWIQAAENTPEALEEIIHHCELDVLLTEEIFIRLMPLVLRVHR